MLSQMMVFLCFCLRAVFQCALAISNNLLSRPGVLPPAPLVIPPLMSGRSPPQGGGRGHQVTVPPNPSSNVT